MTVQHALKQATAKLEQAGLDNPRSQAEWMLQSILKLDGVGLLLNLRQALRESEQSQLKEFLTRRLQGEPLQYILGNTEFRHLLLKTDQRALIPRPETEGLVEIGLELVSNLEHPTILDIGTGCGAIILCLLQEKPDSIGWGMDVNQAALELAAKNAELTGLS
ncbi:MAG: HemK/PrmC family methyltransferase, partial [bacterium]